MFRFAPELFKASSYVPFAGFFKPLGEATTLDVSNFPAAYMNMYCFHFLCFRAEFESVEKIIAGENAKVLVELLKHRAFPCLRSIYVKDQAFCEEESFTKVMQDQWGILPDFVTVENREICITVYGENEKCNPLDDIADTRKQAYRWNGKDERFHCDFKAQSRFARAADCKEEPLVRALPVPERTEFEGGAFPKTLEVFHYTDLCDLDTSKVTTLILHDSGRASSDEFRDKLDYLNALDFGNVETLDSRFDYAMHPLFANDTFRSLKSIYTSHCFSSLETLINTHKMKFTRETDQFITVFCSSTTCKQREITSTMLHDFGDLLRPLALKFVHPPREPDEPELRVLVNRLWVKLTEKPSNVCGSCNEEKVSCRCWVCLENICEDCTNELRISFRESATSQYINTCWRSECTKRGDKIVEFAKTGVITEIPTG